MSRTMRLLLLVIAVSSLFAAGCRAEGTPEPSPNDPSSAGLIEQPKEFDGETVSFRGEAIGEAMRRGEMSWLHVNDDAYYVKNVEEGAQLGGYNTGMPVWIPATLAEEIVFFGDYKHEGDIIEVRGTFNAACAEHGGDMDIHASGLETIEVGHEVVDEVDPDKIGWAAGLSLVAAGLFALTKRREQPAPVRRR